MPLTFSGGLPSAGVARRDAPDELVALVDVVDEHADAAVLDVVPDAGLGDVEEAPRRRPPVAARQRQRQRRRRRRQKFSSSHPRLQSTARTPSICPVRTFMSA